MKLRLLFILCCLCQWFGPWPGHTSSDTEFIETYPLGQINWTRGIVTAPIEHGVAPNGGRISDQAVEQAMQNVVNTLMQLRVDDQRCAARIFEDNRISRAKIEAMARSSKTIYDPKDNLEVGRASVQMRLHGGLAQLMLPSEIRQVQPIKALNGAFLQANSEIGSRVSAKSIAEPGAYTGLIVDARGTGAKPFMVPSLIDEKGQEVFGTAYVSREFAVQHGLCRYMRSMPAQWSAFGRVAPKPLYVKGLRTHKPDSCKIVISNADASRLRGTSAHLEFLKQCRVIIVLDE
jgi:hypothetical protein